MNKYQEKLKNLMDEFAHFVYRVSRRFPKEEMYGLTSQFRRAVLSVVLNYIEGYARKRLAVQVSFFEISYGSLQESKYLLEFSKKEGFINEADYHFGIKIVDEIGAMLWREMQNMESKKQK